MRQKDNKDIGELIRKHKGYVRSIARKYKDKGVEFDDLVQEGNIGIIHAYKRFDKTLGYSFLTYAKWWIEQRIRKIVADQGSDIRVPDDAQRDADRVKRFRDDYYEEFKKLPSLEEICIYFDFSQEKVKRLLETSKRVLRLDDEEYHDGPKLLQIVEDDKATNPEFFYKLRSNQEHLEELLNELPEKYSKPIRLYRRCLGSFTIRRLSEMFNLTPEGMRKRIKRGLEELKRISLHKNLYRLNKKDERSTMDNMNQKEVNIGEINDNHKPKEITGERKIKLSEVLYKLHIAYPNGFMSEQSTKFLKENYGETWVRKDSVRIRSFDTDFLRELRKKEIIQAKHIRGEGVLKRYEYSINPEIFEKENKIKYDFVVILKDKSPS